MKIIVHVLLFSIPHRKKRGWELVTRVWSDKDMLECVDLVNQNKTTYRKIVEDKNKKISIATLYRK